MRAELAGLNHCAVPFLSRAAANLCWYYYTLHLNVIRMSTDGTEPTLIVKDIPENKYIRHLQEHNRPHKKFISVDGYVFPKTCLPYLKRIREFEVIV